MRGKTGLSALAYLERALGNLPLAQLHVHSVDHLPCAQVLQAGRFMSVALVCAVGEGVQHPALAVIPLYQPDLVYTALTLELLEVRRVCRRVCGRPRFRALLCVCRLRL